MRRAATIVEVRDEARRVRAWHNRNRELNCGSRLTPTKAMPQPVSAGFRQTKGGVAMRQAWLAKPTLGRFARASRKNDLRPQIAEVRGAKFPFPNWLLLSLSN